jgi:6-phosphogluconolactonase
MTRTVEVLSSATSLIERALALVVAEAKQAIADRGQFTIALAGGNTPRPLYEQLATQDLPWDQVHVFWGDERYVPVSDPDSNEGMARRAWLDLIAIPPDNVHPMPTSASDPAEAAQTYEQHLQAFFGTPAGEFPRLDVILLGMGPDGHTASLFPQTQALQVCEHLIAVGNKDGQPRLTFTVPMINQGRQVIFLVTGENKRPALAQIFGDQANPLEYPARFINPVGPCIWLLDSAAGAELTTP